MKLAYFAPLPPKRTGVADYAAHLARALAPHVAIDFFDSAPGAAPIPGGRLIDYVARPEAILDLPDYDAVLYQLGNNPEFHAAIFAAFQAYPGPVVLHDAVLYFLIAGLPKGGMLREFLYNHGPDRLSEFFAIERDSPSHLVLRYPQPERYKMLRRVLSLAPSLIVHSATTAALARNLGYERRIDVIPLLAYPTAADAESPDVIAPTRQALGLSEGDVLLGSFGFIGRTKRFSTVFAALARLKERLRFKLLIVGEGPDLTGEIAAHGLSDDVILTGFVDEPQFGRLLRAVDVLVSLRYPSMGETSAQQIQSMACGLPSIVTDHGWFSELPDNAVWKIGVGPEEEDSLTEALLALGQNRDRRVAMGRAARAYIAATCAPEIVARRYLEVLGSSQHAARTFYPATTATGAP